MSFTSYQAVNPSDKTHEYQYIHSGVKNCKDYIYMLILVVSLHCSSFTGLIDMVLSAGVGHLFSYYKHFSMFLFFCISKL